LKTISRGVKSWESLRVAQLFTPHPAAIQVHQKLRYTNNPTGTHRSGQYSDLVP
jgi:hypothetical protein